MIDADVRVRFSSWFEADVRGDEHYSNYTADQVIEWARQNRCLDEVLELPNRLGKEAMHIQEYVAINIEPSQQGNPFPDMRRKGGDHDRGHTPALNAEMRRRALGDE